jgi:hypothetical protein
MGNRRWSLVKFVRSARCMLPPISRPCEVGAGRKYEWPETLVTARVRPTARWGGSVSTARAHSRQGGAGALGVGSRDENGSDTDGYN